MLVKYSAFFHLVIFPAQYYYQILLYFEKAASLDTIHFFLTLPVILQSCWY